MGLFSKIKDARVSKGGVYLLPGNYLLKVETAKLIEDRHNVALLVTEHLIIQSDNEERKPGSHVTWMAKNNQDAFLGNVKAFLCGVLGVSEDDIDEETAEGAFDEDQPLQNQYVKAEAFEIITKKGTPFTKVLWYPVAEDEGKAAEAALDL